MTTTVLALAPFTAEELFALDVAMHVEHPRDHDLMLRHASADYVFHVDVPDALEAVVGVQAQAIHDLVAADILTEIAPAWYGFTAQGVSRACTTVYLNDADELAMFAE